MKQKLTAKQRLFVEEYLKDLNATAAAERAGYSGVTASSMGHQNMQHPRIRAAIDKAMAERSAAVKVEANDVLKRLDSIGDFDPADCYDDAGALKPLRDMPVHIRKCIRSVETFEEFEMIQGKRQKIGETVKVTFWDKVKCNELIGRHLKMFTDKIEVEDTTGLAERMRRARERLKGNK